MPTPAADELGEIYEEMKELIDQADKICRGAFSHDVRYQRAKGYWIAQIRMALDNDHSYMGAGGSTMEDTIKELDPEEEDFDPDFRGNPTPL